MSVRIWHFHPGWKPEMGSSPSDANGYHEVSYEGAVISLREMNGYDDSDFYALVWDDAAGAPKEIQYATTRGWTYNNSAGVDATPEVLAKYEAYEAALAKKRQVARLMAYAKAPHKGALVQVVKGRKFPQGQMGKQIGDASLAFQYKPYRNGYTDIKVYKALVAWVDGSGADYVDVKNLAVVEAAADVMAELKEVA
jgi:hypothetical protein